MAGITYPIQNSRIIIDAPNSVTYDINEEPTGFLISFDGGNYWYDIEDDVSQVTSSSFIWTPDPNSEYVSQNVVHVEDNVILKLTYGSNESVTSEPFYLQYNPFIEVLPNKTAYPPPDKVIYEGTPINITWKSFYPSGIGKVNVYYKVGGNSEFKLNTTPIDNDGQYLWNNGIGGVTGDNIRIKVIAVDDNDEEIESCFIWSDTTGGFTIKPLGGEGQDPAEDDGNNITNTTDYYLRTDMFARVAGEKAILPDEFVTLSQIEVTDDLYAKQRDIDGKLSDDDPTSAFRAYNVVIGLKKPIPDLPRMMTGTINMVSQGTKVQRQGEYYGDVYYYTIQHGWNLTPPRKFLFQIEQIRDSSHESCSDDVKPFFEPISSDAIRVYCTIKDNDKIKDPNGNNNDLNSTYLFYWRLMEIL